jgi:hypothetical protein
MVVTVRDGLDAAFSSRLNLPRNMLDSITTLFVNSQVFLEGAQSGVWPGWLRKKSYFTACSRFAACCLEASGGTPVDAAQFAVPMPAEVPRERDSKKKEVGAAAIVVSANRGGGGDNGNSAAFSSRQGGVFGLRPF